MKRNLFRKLKHPAAFWSFVHMVIGGILVWHSTKQIRQLHIAITSSNSKTLKKVANDDSSVATSSVIPNQCSADNLRTVQYQLPDYDCYKTSNDPWLNSCSFSYATRCPDAVWLTEQYSPTSNKSKRTSTQTTVVRTGHSKSAPQSSPQPPAVLAIYVGCNKAMDAVNALRMISGDIKYDRTQWRDMLFAGQQYEAGRCGQDAGDQFQIVSDGHDGTSPLQRTTAAVVHCIEAMPITAARLNQTAHTLGWQDQLVVSNVAMSDTDGSALFPNVDDKIGVENMGFENCQGKGAKNSHCKVVPLYRLDTFAELHMKMESSMVDFLSIDVEGFDYEVLLGAPQLMKRTKYIEFEYNWKGKWKDHKLSTAIDMLKDAGFVCYWPGSFGHIWRITDCWLDYYDLKFWSNVACVNVQLPDAAPLALRMEELFRKTLDAGQNIQYSSKSTANTDGGYRAA